LEAKIAHLCGYIRDDSTIAAYLQIDIAQVHHVRRTSSRLTETGWTHKHILGSKPGDLSGMDYETKHRGNAQAGSEKLAKALNRQFEAFEDEHMLVEGAGQLLLMDYPGLPHPKSLKAPRKLKWVRA
jgi:hypothetical protein